MAYDKKKPPAQITETVGGGNSVWLYSSADDAATVNGAGYISNAKDLGMKVGDIVNVIDTETPKGSLHFVSTIGANGAATLAFCAVA